MPDIKQSTVSKKLAVICTINNPRLYTTHFVEYFTANPACGVILFLDNPQHMEYFEQEDVPENLLLYPCTEDHWARVLGRLPHDMPEKQHSNLTAGASIARDKGYTWGISLDGDELIRNLGGLIQQVDDLGEGVDLLRLLPAELIHVHDSAFTKQPFSGEYFRYCLTRKGLRLRRKKLTTTLKKRLLEMKPFTNRLFFGHTNGKTLFRLASPITKFKQHKQFSESSELVEKKLPKDYLILHFDAMNYSLWRFKWKRRINGKTKATAISDKRKIQTNLIAKSLRWYMPKAARRLFESWYVFSCEEIRQMEKANLIFRNDRKNCRVGSS